MSQCQRGPDGLSIPKTDYPPIPDAKRFFTGYAYETPKEVHYWTWRTDYNKWGACVTFVDGKRMVTNPEPEPEWYLHTKNIRPDGTTNCHLTRRVKHKVSELPWQKEGLTFTATGYGSRIPTEHMIKVDGRWRRVYCRIYSNSGTLFIGKKCDGSAVVTKYG